MLSDGEPLFGMVEEIRVGRSLHFCARHFYGMHNAKLAANKGECLATLDVEFMKMSADPHRPVRFLVMDGTTEGAPE